MTGPTLLPAARLAGLAGGATAEDIQDAVASALDGAGGIAVTYDDELNKIVVRNVYALADVYAEASSLPLADLLTKLTPGSATYAPPWALTYQVLVGSGAMPDRRSVVRLVPTAPAGGALTSVSWDAAGGLPAGTLSAQNVYNNSATYSVGKALDGNSTTYTYPASANKIGWWLQFELGADVAWKALQMSLSTGDYRPTSCRVSLGGTAATLVDVQDYSLDFTPNGQSWFLHNLQLPSHAPCKVLRVTFLTMFNTALAGYPVNEIAPFGII